MFRVALVSCLVALAVAYPFTAELDYEWGLFKQTYNKQYEPEVEYLRRFIWERNLQLVNTHNQEEALGLHTYKLGMNEYADLENSEFVAMLNGYKQQNVSASVCTKYKPTVGIQDLPDTVDWRKEGLVTEIKNQGQCGSCWSFSTTGSLEGQNFKKTGKLVSLSEKNLMDCSRKEGNKGCEGGLMDNAFAYVIKNNGIDTEESYPYVPRDSRSCNFKQADVGATEVGCEDIAEGSESDLQSAVATVGPISVAIDASHSSFQLYRSGVYSERRCSSKKLDHGVLAVGYGTEESKDYWLVKNSWGRSWGQEGYIMMSRNKENQCGIASAASFPTM